MNHDPASSTGDLSLSALKKIDELCDAFVREWTQDSPPSMERILSQNSDLPRAVLLHRLLREELQLRRSKGESPTLDEYRQRFPTDGGVVDRAWQEFLAEPGTAEFPRTEVRSALQARPPDTRERIGRFLILRQLGYGSFGTVYLARDSSTGVEVALKVAHAGVMASETERNNVFREFRSASRLEHPNLVQTLGIEYADGQLVIVQQFIDGQTLAKWFETTKPSPDEVVRLLIPVAHALGYLHEKGVFHRDLKPSNILVDQQGRPFVTDFGLALHEDEQRDPEHRGKLAGTLAYMAPEQISGNVQLIDGQTDIWSFGVILYRLLTNRFPFGGQPSRHPFIAEEYRREIEYEIANHDPRPPRQINPKISRNIERVCLKCLDRQKRDRYRTGYDLAEALQLVLERKKSISPEAPLVGKLPIVPKGLRSFEAADAPFFLELLPGPKTLDGVPASLSFWRNRLSNDSGDGPIDVGVLYGPSGSGKSSLVKAGLIPLLGDGYVTLVIEATPDDTEVRILKSLQRAIPGFPRDVSVIEAFRLISERGAGGRRKVLLVIDQFEQWLHAHLGLANQQLLVALRQCNGTLLQALLLVRDDFWMPLSRFMAELEIPLQENKNIAAVDLFDCDHARKILVGLGQAYGRLPDDQHALTPAQQRFLTSSIDALSENRRIICVRLALFAEMMKDRPWTPEELDNLGGAQGIGVAFLEEKFGPNAPANYRPHRTAVRKVMESLLPPFGTDLKGQMKTVDELRAAVGAISTSSFEQLVQLLVSDLKLLTPVVPDEPVGQPKLSSVAPEEVRYQLTHDYVVPSIREWLTRKRRETWRGRGRLCLEERSMLWSSRREKKQLPTLLETMQITLATRRSQWTDRQVSMMRVAQRYHSLRVAILGLFILAVSVAGWAWQRHQDEIALRDVVIGQGKRLLVADIGHVAQELEKLEPTFDLWHDRMVYVAEHPDTSPDERLRATMALIQRDPSRWSSLLAQLTDADPRTLGVIRNWLAQKTKPDSAAIWAFARTQSSSAQLRFAVLLAEFDPEAPERWPEMVRTIVPVLLSEEGSDVLAWSDLLLPVARPLSAELSTMFLASAPSSDRRQTAAMALAKLGNVELLGRLIPDADAAVLAHLLRPLATEGETVAKVLQPLLSAAPPTDNPESHRKHISRQRMCCAALLRLGQDDKVWPFLQGTEDPTLRTELILSLTSDGVTLASLLRGEEKVRDAVARQAIWLAMAGRTEELSADQIPELIARLTIRWPYVETVAERSAMVWLAQKCGTDIATYVLPEPSTRGPNWRVNTQGQVLAEFRGPLEFSMGSPENERRRDGNETMHQRRIDHSFAIGVHEVTVEQFQRFQEHYSPDPQVGPSPKCPASSLSWLDAVRYCRWLSDKEGIHEDQMCYPPFEQIHENMTFPDNMLSRTGYRLPTESEWEFVCRAGSRGRYFFGEDERHASAFAWTAVNSQEQTWPVGQLRPNSFGLFDIQGNVHEWCQDAFGGYTVDRSSAPAAETAALAGTDRVFRGATFRSPWRPMRSAFRFRYAPSTNFSILGFRVARTLPNSE